MAGGIAERAARLLAAKLRRARPIAGGDLSAVVELELDDGRTAIAKGGPAPLIEAAMLEAIAATGAPAPAVLAADETTLVLESLRSGGRLDDAWRDLGTALTKLHAGRRESGGGVNASYGWDVDYAFGELAIENSWMQDWPRFWAERRLRNQAPHLPPGMAARVETLAGDLGNRLPARPEPCLLHGDLWAGNVVVDAGKLTGLIDPACYYGDREVDFAMLRLFGHPGAELFEAYGPLEPGQRERLPIYQLWPALVHLRLFGSAYAPMVDRMLGAAGV